jgi:hypothetical protein
MNRALTCILGLGVAAASTMAQDAQPCDGSDRAKLTDPRAILKQAEEALKSVKLVRYQVKYGGTGWVAQFVAQAEGSAMLGEPSRHDIARFRCDVKLTPPGGTEAIELSAGSDGDLFFLIDPQTKTVYADIDEAVLGTHHRDLQRVLLPDFVGKEPLADALKAEKVELKENTRIGGEPCYQVRVVESETREDVWSISQNDLLPRRVDRVYREPNRGEGGTSLELTELVAATEFHLAPFELRVPDGYTKTDEFAP